jgi:glycosyltransferase involved in cell wall biosynthesis
MPATEKKIAVLALGPLPPPYHGVATFLRDLLASKDLPDIEFTHIDTSDSRDASNLGQWDGENIRLGFANLAELASRCGRSEAQIVYLPLSQSVPAFLRDALFILEARALGKRVVVHLHGGYFRTLFESQSAAFQSLARAALGCVSGAIVLGESFRGIFAGLIPDERVFVVENGVLDCGFRRRFGFTESRRIADCGLTEAHHQRLLYMSTLTRTKGLLELIEALAILRRSRPEVKLNVAGEWQEPDFRDECLAAIQRQSLAEHVHFAGNVVGEAKAAFLASGDIFCLPTRYPYEGQPLVILEAMAAGIPVLSTDRGVIASTVIDGQSGRILPQESTPEKLAEALAEMLRDPARVAAMGQAARERYEARYTLRECHHNVAQVFLKIAGQLPP